MLPPDIVNVRGRYCCSGASLVKATETGSRWASGEGHAQRVGGRLHRAKIDDIHMHDLRGERGSRYWR